MAYVINKFDGTPLLVLEDGTLNTSTSVGLLGRNYIGYGETQNENFVHLLENFANDFPPSTPIVGQTWYNRITETLNVYTGTSWIAVNSAVLSDTAPVAAPGFLWYNTNSNQLFLYNSDRWDLIGPEAVAGFGNTRLVSDTIIDSADNVRPIIKVTIDDEIIAIISKDTFTIGPTNTISNFFNVRSGITLSSNHSITSNVFGNSTTASSLETPRAINGVTFDGSTDVVIKSSTTNFLKPGKYLVGLNFDGTDKSIWDVDATSINSIDKIVARDNQGNFAAGTVTAELSGNSTTTTRLQTARTINGIAFNGASDIDRKSVV
jgi:hypothetical protein